MINCLANFTLFRLHFSFTFIFIFRSATTPLWRTMTSELISKTLCYHERIKRVQDSGRREVLKANLKAEREQRETDREQREIDRKDRDSRCVRVCVPIINFFLLICDAYSLLYNTYLLTPT